MKKRMFYGIVERGIEVAFDTKNSPKNVKRLKVADNESLPNGFGFSCL